MWHERDRSEVIQKLGKRFEHIETSRKKGDLAYVAIVRFRYLVST